MAEDQEPLTLALSQRERGLTELSGVIHRPESMVSIMDSAQHVQVGVARKHPPISPLSPWERVRVRALVDMKCDPENSRKQKSPNSHEPGLLFEDQEPLTLALPKRRTAQRERGLTVENSRDTPT